MISIMEALSKEDKQRYIDRINNLENDPNYQELLNRSSGKMDPSERRLNSAFISHVNTAVDAIKADYHGAKARSDYEERPSVWNRLKRNYTGDVQRTMQDRLQRSREDVERKARET